MSEQNGLPKGWIATTIGEVSKTQTGGTPSRGRPEFFSGSIPWVKSGELRDGVVFDTEEKITEEALHSSNAKLFPKGTLCIALYGATIGRLAILGIEATTNQAICGIFLPEQINPRYVFRYLEWKRPDLIELGQGGAQPNISNGIVRQTGLLLPPFNEQRRIVEKIDELFSELDAGVAALKRIKANLKRYRAAVLKAAVVGRLTEEWRAKHPRTEPASKLLERILAERRKKWGEDQLAKFAADDKEPPKKWREKYVEPAAPDTSELRELPKGWTWATVEQVTHFAKYGSSAKTSTDDAGVPVLRMGNIQDGSLDLTDLKYLPKDHDEFPDLLLQEGDLLFNRTNSAELVGKSAIYHGNPTPCSYASYLIGLRTVCGCTPELLCYYLNSWCGRAWIASVVSQQVGQANVNGSKLQALVFPLPPVPEQTQIIAEVERCFSNIAVAQAQVDTNLKRADRLCQSILKRAFEGNLVPQDPTDEPADKLLERIRQERTATNGNGVAPRTRRGRVAKQNTPKAKRTESHHE